MEDEQGQDGTRKSVPREPWDKNNTIDARRSDVTEPVYQEVVKKRLDDLFLDVTNVAAIRLLTIVAEQINNSTEAVLDSDFRLLVTGDSEVLFDYYLLNTLALSYFEEGMYLLFTEPLCYKESEFAVEIVRYFDTEKELYTVTREEDENKKRQAIVERFAEKYTRSDYIRFINEKIDIEPHIDIDEELLDTASEMSETRGSIVHNFSHLFKSGDPQTVKNQAARCKLLVNLTEDLLHQELLINEDLLDMMQS